jgi:hypothetical protein
VSTVKHLICQDVTLIDQCG